MNRIDEWFDSHPKAFAGIMITIIIVGGIIIATPMVNEIATSSPDDGGSHDLATEHCVETFGEGSSYSEWMGGDPPTLTCEGPDGEQAYMTMPEEVADELDIRAAAYEEDNA